MRSTALALFVVCWCANLSGQDVTVGSVIDQTETQAFLIICDTDPGKFIVLDDAGLWLPDVKSADVIINIGNPATIRCTMYAGLIKPTNPLVRSFMLVQIQSVPLTDFQKMIDGLQRDAAFVKKDRDKTTNLLIKK